uniref:Uncharacterized protein n=1 Tax=Glossina palpalis gambiensis TaxID=67801 RepID=A0A1B0B535_9MUSC
MYDCFNLNVKTHKSSLAAFFLSSPTEIIIFTSNKCELLRNHLPNDLFELRTSMAISLTSLPQDVKRGSYGMYTPIYAAHEHRLRISPAGQRRTSSNRSKHFYPILCGYKQRQDFEATQK